MKIISIVTSFPRNDQDILIPWIIRLIEEFRAENIETEIFTSTYCGLGNEIRDGIKVTRFRYFFKKWERLSHDMSVPEKLKSNKQYFLVLPFFMFFGTVAAFNYARKNHFDVIHVHFPFPLAIFGIAMKMLSKKPIIVTCHGSEVNMAKKNRFFKTVFKFIMKYADSITVNSLFMKKELVKIIGNREIKVIPMGSGIGDVENKEFEKEKNKDRKKILFVGRLIEWKGIKYLIEAFKKLDQEKYELHIVGDGPERKALERDSVQFPKTIFFHGYLKGEKLDNMYKHADCFVLPSIVDDSGFTEGLGTVLLEAISFGIPVIGSDVGGIPDIIINFKTGMLVPEKNSQAIAEAVEFLEKNENLRIEILKNAKEHVQENFSWKLITSNFRSIYKNCSE